MEGQNHLMVRADRAYYSLGGCWSYEGDLTILDEAACR